MLIGCVLKWGRNYMSITKYFLILATLAGTFGNQAAFADRKSIYVDYLKPLLKRETHSAPDVWNGAESGGCLFRFKMDVNGDGTKEMFLTSSLETFNLSATWKIFSETSSGQFIPFDKTVRWPMTELRMERTPEGLFFWQWSQDEMTYYVTRTSFRNGQVLSETMKVPFDQFIDGEEAKLLKRTQVVQPDLESIALADFLRNSNAPWKKVDFKTLQANGMDYPIITTDVEQMKSIRMTPQLALYLIDPSTPIIKPKPESLPTTTPQRLMQSVTALSLPTVFVEKQFSSSFPILPVAIVVALILGVVIYILRRKSK